MSDPMITVWPIPAHGAGHRTVVSMDISGLGSNPAKITFTDNTGRKLMVSLDPALIHAATQSSK
jgi:hypothetical protein